MAEPHASSEEVDRESRRRRKLGIPLIAAGALFVLSAVTASSVFSSAPSVSLTRALMPALTGRALPAVSARTERIRYFSHHSLALIAGSVMLTAALAIASLAVLVLWEAARSRRASIFRPARILILVGLPFAAVPVANSVLGAVETHRFAVGHDHSLAAADRALSSGTIFTVLALLGVILGLAFAIGIGNASLNAMRVGLVPRWMGVFGLFVAVALVLLQAQGLSIIGGVWALSLGLLYLGRLPGGDPPAWASGEARPWPSAAEQREARQRAGATGGGARRSPRNDSKAAGAALDGPPQPVAPTRTTPRVSAKRKRKRGARG